MLPTHTNSLPFFQRNFPSDRPFTTSRHGTVLGFMEGIFNDANVDVQYHLSTGPQQLFWKKNLAIPEVRRGYDLMALLNPKRLLFFLVGIYNQQFQMTIICNGFWFEGLRFKRDNQFHQTLVPPWPNKGAKNQWPKIGKQNNLSFDNTKRT